MNEKLKKTGGALHLLGLVSPGGVHSSMEHLYALVDLAAASGVEKIYIHAFLDGRDTPPKSASGYLEELEKKIAGKAKVSSVCGRFYAMDRDNRWERVQTAYDAMTSGEGLRAAHSVQAVKDAYKRDETDEFVSPTLIVDEGDAPATIEEGDAVLFFNFRSDRAREMTRALAFEDFDGFERKRHPKLSYYATMTEYHADFNLPSLFPPTELGNIFGEVISRFGLKQLRIAETEKYAHVTFFMNGGREAVFENEDRVLIPSPKVKTYDMKPEMSAREVTDQLLERMDDYDVVMLNFANPDMVGHTGDFEAAVKAVETVDECLGRIVEKVEKDDWMMVVTADHGNAELMYDESKGSPHTAHTTNPVPFVVFNGPKDLTLSEGILADVAPTFIKLMGYDVPAEMSGRVLF